MGDSSSSRSSQVNISVQPNYEIMSLTTFNITNISKAMSVASDAQHALTNFMDSATIDFARTQLAAKKSRVKIEDSVTKVLAELHRLNSTDCVTEAIDGVAQAERTFFCDTNIPRGQPLITNLANEQVYRKYYAEVDALAKRHSTESPERVKEMIEKLIKNLGKHPSKEKTQHQILSLGRAIKLLPENERRDFKGYLTQVATARYELIASIAKCSEMHMLRVECMIDSYSNDVTRKEKRDREEDEEGDRNISDRNKGRQRGEYQTLTPCNHCNKNHPLPCNLLNNHPDCNPDAGIPFAESEKGKLWLSKGHTSVSTQQTLDGSVWSNPNFRQQSNNQSHNRLFQSHHNNHKNRHNNSHRGGHDNRHHNRNNTQRRF